MASKDTFKCNHCRKPFQARTADRARGWARFCSKSCKAKAQERRTGQNAAYRARAARREREETYNEACAAMEEGWDGHKGTH